MTDLNALAAEDSVIRNLARIMRDGSPSTLEQAVEELAELGVDRNNLDRAAERIRELNRQISDAQTPRAVVAGNIESWYSGPRAEDRNWPELVKLLIDDGWPEEAIRDLDESSTKVVANLPNPAGREEYQCRGLVLGYVQSGKTTNFTAVIAKAADAGYRFFIVLSGIHDALRQQTQDRLNEQIFEPRTDIWHRLTNEQDFTPTASVDALLSTRDQRVLAIVKKNSYRLKALNAWLFGARPELLASCPVLIIDDEADQASVSTSKPERQPTAINRLIRDIVNKVPKSAYVGYTATPFANVLIDPKNYSDLYPRDFIVDLPRPRVYLGPEAIFGREPLDFDDEEVDDGHDFVRSVPESEIDDLKPKGAAQRHTFDPDVTPSLDEAIRYFLLSTSARRIRRRGNPHATALVHTSQHIDIHERTASRLKLHLQLLRHRLAQGDGQLYGELRTQWQQECHRVQADGFGLSAVSWEELEPIIAETAADVEVITDNSRSTERLNFDDENPRAIIAVGGNTLSRGLTLEGLAVSFFIRTASAYDTLLQMGRWFGFRSGYADLTRIWMTDEMRGWFYHLATVEQEIRYDIQRLETEHLTPEEFGIRIRTHPKLAITAAAKMQNATRAEVSYSGRRLQTILFNHKDRGWLRSNIDAARSLVDAASSYEQNDIREGVTIYRSVPPSDIVGFISAYRFHENSRDLDNDLISRYILDRQDEGELLKFNVAVMGHSSPTEQLGTIDMGTGRNVGCINRARLARVGATYADIKALMGRIDHAIDLKLPWDTMPSDIAFDELMLLRNTPEVGGNGDGSGLVLLYPISKGSQPTNRTRATRVALDAAEHILGVGIVFPKSASSRAVVDYVTADIASMPGIDVDAPDALDEPVEDAPVHHD